MRRFYVYKNGDSLYSYDEKRITTDEYVGSFFSQKNYFRLERVVANIQLFVEQDGEFVFFYYTYTDEDLIYRKRIFCCLRVKEIPFSFPQAQDKKVLKEYFRELLNFAKCLHEKSFSGIAFENWIKNDPPKINSKDIDVVLDVFDA